RGRHSRSEADRTTDRSEADKADRTTVVRTVGNHFRVDAIMSNSIELHAVFDPDHGCADTARLTHRLPFVPGRRQWGRIKTLSRIWAPTGGPTAGWPIASGGGLRW